MPEIGFDPWVGEDPLEEEIATHSSVLAWRIPQTEEPGGLYSPWGHRESGRTEQLSHTYTDHMSQSCSLRMDPQAPPWCGLADLSDLISQHWTLVDCASAPSSSLGPLFHTHVGCGGCGPHHDVLLPDLPLVPSSLCSGFYSDLICPHC